MFPQDEAARLRDSCNCSLRVENDPDVIRLVNAYVNWDQNRILPTKE
jgi:hypothetical protein